MAELIVALDTDSARQAKQWVKRLAPVVRTFKVGSQLFTACGPAIVEWIHRQGGRVFLDLKFHDIPQTMANAARVATRLGVCMFNLHASAGREALRAAQAAARAEASRRHIKRPLVIAVTVLTSLDSKDLRHLGVSRSIQAHVASLARLAKRAGLDGVVASAHEIQAVRRVTGRSFLIVTPGVRPSHGRRDDQKRVAAPRAAAGADYVVIGRPITQAADPLRAAEAILEQLRVEKGAWPFFR